MSIFRRETPPAPISGPAESLRSPGGLTHVAAGTRLRGEVTGTAELLVEGEIEGEIRLEAPVTVGAEGVVVGPVMAPVVRVSGRVIGNVAASDRVEVSASGILEGDIASPRIVIAEGAFFKGRVQMRGDRPGSSPS